MLEFKQDDTAAVMILTLTELVTLSPVYYLFVFNHVTTKEVVAFVKATADEESLFPIRYNQFTIDASVIFDGKQPGEWHYKVYEQSSAVNTSPAAAGGVIEFGKLYLDRATDFDYDKYNTATTFKTYNG